MREKKPSPIPYMSQEKEKKKGDLSYLKSEKPY